MNPSRSRSLAPSPTRSPTPSPIRSIARPAARRVADVGALALVALIVAGCASKPIDIDGDTIQVAPVTASQVASEPEQARGTVLWGGTIIGVASRESGSQLELLAYPLDRTQRPQDGRRSQGRFIVTLDEYLEPLDFAEGRQVTVLGELDGLEEVRVGDTRRQLPVVKASQLHLWTGAGPRERTGFTFGIGVGSGGRTSGGVGIGIGLGG